VAAVVDRLPRATAVAAPRGAVAARLVRPAGRYRMPRERVDVELGAGAVVLPRLSPVGRPHQAAELDAHEQEPGVVRTGRDPAHVRGPRARREAPGRRRGNGAQRLEL